MAENTIVGAIEMGTSKIVVLIGEIVQSNMLNIIGMSQVRSEGIKKGEILDFKVASQAVHTALAQAEKSAGVRLNTIYLSQTGSHLRGHLNVGMVNVSASNNIVSRLDMKRVDENAKSKELSQEYVYIHHIKNPYKLDGRVVRDPYMMEGERLEASYWSVHGHVKKVRDAIHIVNGFGLKVEDMILSSIASGSMVTTESERKNGVLVIDIGCGTTDFVVYKDGYILKTGVIPVGGDHITNDLSLGLRTSLENAEKIKQEHARAIMHEDSSDWVLLNTVQGTQERRVAKEAIYKIVHARMQELIQLVAKQLEPWVSYSYLPAGIVLTGGTSHLKYLEWMVAQELGLEVRLGTNPYWANAMLKAPEYSTSLGLLHYALDDKSQYLSEMTDSPQVGMLNKVAKIFRRVEA